jgi:hypothetical protein
MLARNTNKGRDTKLTKAVLFEFISLVGEPCAFAHAQHQQGPETYEIQPTAISKFIFSAHA